MFKDLNIINKIKWLNIHCKNNFIVTMNDHNKKFNLIFNNKKIKQNLTKHLLNKELNILEYKLSIGKNLDKIL